MSVPAARVGHLHKCPKSEPGPVPHIGGPILEGSGDVFLGGDPCARIGDKLTCNGPPDSISTGCSTVLVNGKPIARKSDSTSHGGSISEGITSILVG